MKHNEGFLTIDVLVLATILLCLSSLWALFAYFNQIQKLNAEHYSAVLLAQGYLNKYEYEINKQALPKLTSEERVKVGDIDFTVNSNIAEQAATIYKVKVYVKWKHNDEMQMEEQERIVVKF